MQVFTQHATVARYSFGDKEVMHLLEQEDKLIDISATTEDYFPFIQYIYKTKNFRVFEEFKEEWNAFIQKKYDEAFKTFDKGVG